MNGERNLATLLANLNPTLNEGEYVFYTTRKITPLEIETSIFIFREHEGTTVVLDRTIAERLKIRYSFVASWITLTVHSSLEAVGLTATFSSALAEEDIACNIVAGYYHDHIFVNPNDSAKAMTVLNALAARY